MRRGPVAALLVVALGILVTGCASIQTATSLNDQRITADASTPVAHVYGSNWGIYFLLYVPLLTGDTAKHGTIAVGRDTVSVAAAVDMVTRKSKELGVTRTTDIQSSSTSVWIIPLPVFWYKSVQVSGNATK
jgi:uncharacterized protein YceK